MTAHTPIELPTTRQLLFSRKQVAKMLGNVSIFTIIRLEKAGLLSPIKLGRTPTSQTFYAADNVEALIDHLRTEAATKKEMLSAGK